MIERVEEKRGRRWCDGVTVSLRREGIEDTFGIIKKEVTIDLTCLYYIFLKEGFFFCPFLVT